VCSAAAFLAIPGDGASGRLNCTPCASSRTTRPPSPILARFWSARRWCRST
jgi:hypothetical protein